MVVVTLPLISQTEIPMAGSPLSFVPEFQAASYEGWSPRAMAAWMMRLQYMVVSIIVFNKSVL